MALEEFGPQHTEAISIDYGQRHIKESECASALCNLNGVEHTVLDLKGILSGPGVMLTSTDIDVPNVDYSDIHGVSPTYVPFRNGTMLSIITAHAQKYVNAEIEKETAALIRDEYNESSAKIMAAAGAKDLCTIYFGAHAEDAQNWAYPDCTPEFVGAMANAIYIGTYMTIRLCTPFVFSTKAEIVSKGSDLHVPYDMTWSCYKGEALHCGTCPTCRARKQAFTAAGVIDPTKYADWEAMFKAQKEADEDPF